MKPTTQRWIARLLLLTFANPAMLVAPAWAARDTDIYSGFAAESSTVIKPNILLLIDTSDSMNYPEAWKEYPGDYDSHVEYLWNDLSAIVDADSGTGSEATSEDSSRISTAAVPSGGFDSRWGFWSGSTLADRRALWQAARASAKATESGDPGARSIWRNYDDLSWIYWLPAGTSETDSRLRSPAWNRFRGYIKELGNGAGGGERRGLYFNDINDYRIYNQCSASLASLTPSTVFVPSAYAKNSGKYLNQQWARWEPYINLTAVNVSGYPGKSATVTYNGQDYAQGYLDMTNASTGNPAANPVYRDSSGSSPTGKRGLPIRMYGDANPGAGWTDMKADLGGYNFRDEVFNYSDKTKLESVMGLYSLPVVTDVDTSGSVSITDSKFVAWKGNRDNSPAPAFGSVTGVHAYYDITASTCSSSTGPSSSTCIDNPTGTDVANFTLTKNATCNLTGATSYIDADGYVFRKGGSCAIGTITQSGTDQNGTGTYPSFTDVPAPTVCPAPTTANNNVPEYSYTGCSMGTTQVTTATTCSLINNQTLTIGNCAPSGGTAVTINNCSWSGRSSDTVANCAWSGRSSVTIGTCAWSGRTTNYVENVGWFASGGSCQENARSTFCSGTTSASGPYQTQAEALTAISNRTGCTNTTSAGTYQYGGTCTENGSAEECQISGGTTVAGYANFNASCSNAGSPGAGTYNYGGTCSESGSGSANTTACQITGGTSRTIRGVTRTYDQNCSNKSNAGTTYNQAGTYYSGQSCTGTNNTCTNGTTTSFIVRGTSYNTISSCTNGRTPGTYNRGGTCSGTNVPCTTVTGYGGTSYSISGFTWYANKATCTAPTGAQSYNSSCTGTMRQWGTPSWTVTNNTASACNSTTNTVTINGTNYTNYLTCTDKPDTTKTCSTLLGGSSCSTGCGNATPTSVTGGASSQTHNYYRTYNFGNKTDYLHHDCKADDGGSKYMHFNSSTISAFGNPWDASLSYATTSTGGVAADDTRKVDMYSVNYLNWKYGPKGPNGYPIGRKTRLQVAKDVLSDISASISGIRMGLMSFNQMEKEIPSGALAGNSSGSHLVKAVKDLGATGSTARNELVAGINALKASAATPLTESLYEAYRYYRGDSPRYGGSTYQAKEARNSPVNGSTIYVTDGIDTSSDALTGGNYKSPITETCQENFVILVTDGAPENDTDANDLVKALNDGAGITTKQATTTEQFEATSGTPYGPVDTKGPPEGSNYVWLDELAYYMARADASSAKTGTQTVKLHTVGFGISAPVLDNAALQGKGNAYTATDSATLKAALEAAIKAVTQWQPQGNVAAISYQRTTGQSGDVYISFFSPSEAKTWPGTIKKYRYGYGATTCGSTTNSCGNGNVCLTGNDSVTYGSCGKNVEEYVFDQQLGVELPKFRNNAVSLWIPASPSDGGSGSKGGSGQMLLSSMTPDTRKLYTFIPGTSTSATLSAAGNLVTEANLSLTTAVDLNGDGTVDTSSGVITKTMLGDSAMTDTRQRELVRFARGSDGSNATTWRAWPYYDSVHSAPAVDEAEILPSTTPKSFYSTVYVMTSDGVLHAINASTGAERWAFMVPEGLAKISDFMLNVNGEHIEVADGAPVLTTTADNKRLVIFGMRRGGRAYYALDVTDQDNPKFAWKISNTQKCSGATCSSSTDYSELGYTFSVPAVGYIRGYVDPGSDSTSAADDKLKPVLVYGGGYDPNQDSTTATTDSMGRAVFVTDAATGDKIAQFDLLVSGAGYSVPSDVLALDTTGDAAGTLDRIYVGDMGGRLWRMDLDDRSTSNASSGWSTSLVRLAQLGSTSVSKKIFNRPSMAPAIYAGQAFDAVFVGTGDLQKPTTNSSSDGSALYMVKDFAMNKVASQVSPVPSATTTGDFVDVTDKTTYDSVYGTTSTLKADLLAAKGYVIKLGLTAGTYGEKVSSQPLVLAGKLYFGAYLPGQAADAGSSAAQCRVGGYGRQYAIDALTGTPLFSSSGSALFSQGNGRVGSLVAGFGRGSTLVGGPGQGIFVRPQGTGSGTDAVTVNPFSRTFWYTVPER